MDDNEFLAGQFEQHRGHLRAVSYRMLGSLSEADDAVQEAWVRLSRSDAEEIENLGGWLTTVVARVCLNMLRARKTRNEEPLDDRLPDPVVERIDGGHPEHEALLADLARGCPPVGQPREGDFERLDSVLHPDVVLRVDLGPEDPVREISGAETVAGQAIMFGRDAPASDTTETVLVNGTLGELRFRGGQPFSLLAYTIANDRIVEMDIIADTARLARLGLR